MQMRWIVRGVGALVAWGLGAAMAWAQAPSTPLIGPAALAQLMQADPPAILLDASPTVDHRRHHIPGAVPVDYFAYGLRDGSAAERQQWLQSLGIARGRKVVVYDQGGTYLAPRLFHELVYAGVPEQDIELLDGGLTRWRAEGRAVTDERTPPPARGDHVVTALREDLRVRLPEFLQATGDTARHALVDALGPDHYYGGAKFFDRGGHVPQAVNWPAEDFFNADKTFKPAAEIRRMAAWLGVRPEQTVHTHCGGGGAAAVPWFALRHLAGFPKVTLYRESQLEWLRDERGLPFWTHAQPFLQRETTWLATWGGAMMRMVGAGRISVVDVRPEAAYHQGHVPFALSLPAEDFAALARQPGALAARLGAAGVDPANEAVVVSDGGLNRRSALAFLLLSHLGQARVSWLAESVDEWGLRGLALTKAPTAVGTPRSPQDPAVRPAVYPPDRRQGVLLPALEAGTGPHPRHIVAIGSAPPQRAPASPWPRIAVEAMVGPDGAVKPAGEIWTALAKAGVPRYGELVVIADEPGDAAIGYAVLQLMGFHGVKVWWP